MTLDELFVFVLVNLIFTTGIGYFMWKKLDSMDSRHMQMLVTLNHREAEATVVDIILRILRDPVLGDAFMKQIRNTEKKDA